MPSRLRKNWLFSDTVAGAKANNVDVYQYLIGLFKALPLAQMADDYEALLP